ncbi:MAG TPA: hypothetical protein VF551_05255 [Chthoniobacterales bacterium]|jgi:hypothetical protein
MRRRRLALIAVPLLLAIAIWVAVRTETPRPTEVRPSEVGATPSASPEAVAEAASSSGLKQGQLTASPTGPPAAPAASITPADPEAIIEVDKVSLMIRDYRSLAGENPVGTNAEIMSAVMGGNPKQAKLGPPEGMQLNEKGELIDRWGTPYFFHQLSRDHMEIRSAAADKVMWTEDDAVVR